VLYTMLIYQDPSVVPDPESSEGQAEMQHWFSYSEELGKSGDMKAGEALLPVDSATTVRERDGQTLTTDGPFAETKEILAGFYLIDVPDLDAALEWAAKMPNIKHGTVEVRPVAVFD
jgi:hypothetical protein